MNKLFILCAVLFQTSIYTVHFTDNAGTDKTFAAYSGKRILIVNIAGGSPRASQLAGLQQLYAQHHDSLVIIAFPSNSFGHEPLDNTAIKSFCENTYHTTFPIAAKGIVAGSNLQGIYAWLASAEQNGAMNASVKGDFQKFLIDKDGKLAGVFASSVLPTDSMFIAAVTGN